MIEAKYYVNGKEFTDYKEAQEYEYLWRKSNSKYKVDDVVYYLSCGTIYKTIIEDINPDFTYMWYALVGGAKKKEEELFSTPEELCENLKNNIIDYKNGTA